MAEDKDVVLFDPRKAFCIRKAQVGWLVEQSPFFVGAFDAFDDAVTWVRQQVQDTFSPKRPTKGERT